MRYILSITLILVSFGTIKSTATTPSCNHDTDENLIEFYKRFNEEFKFP